MNEKNDYFFCGIGGSGMLPLAAILNARGHRVAGSDRAFDQGRTPAKFDYLKSLGMTLFPQDGSGITDPRQILVASAAVEDTVPDVAAAIRHGAERLTRAALLARIFNDANLPIGVAGTSGKSTTTAMVGWILQSANLDPTIMNGAVMKNFVDERSLFASARVGEGAPFVSEIDESDGSIAMFNASIAVLNNISLDHKSMDELRALFGAFLDRVDIAVLNLDNAETRQLATVRQEQTLTYSITDKTAHFYANDIVAKPFGVSFDVVTRDGERASLALKMPGLHNVSNALAAITAATAAGVSLAVAASALCSFEGVKRRLEYVGERNRVTVIDDFAHNPDKISASLKTLHEFDGRLLVMFQPHGFGPLKKMKDEFIDTFADHLGPGDFLLMPPPAYFGGTVDRAVTHEDIVAGLKNHGLMAEACETREACAKRLKALARPGDRIVIMGARDDTLSTFASDLLEMF